MAKTFISKWVLNSRTGQIEQEIDKVRSIYPYGLASGYWSWGAGSTDTTSILTVPSACRFQLGFLWINNADATNVADVMFYDGAGTSVPAGRIFVASTSTVIKDFQNPWLVFASGVYASVNTSLVQIRVAGILVESGPE